MSADNDRELDSPGLDDADEEAALGLIGEIIKVNSDQLAAVNARILEHEQEQVVFWADKFLFLLHSIERSQVVDRSLLANERFAQSFEVDALDAIRERTSQ